MIARLALLASLAAACGGHNSAPRLPTPPSTRSSPKALTASASAPCGVIAQPGAQGSLHGTVLDQSTGEPLMGATIFVSSTSLFGTQAAITEPNGSFVIPNLPPGLYEVHVWFASSKTTYHPVPVSAARVTTFAARIAPYADATKVVEIDPSDLCRGSSRGESWHLIQASR